jgi:cytochrome P450
MATTSPAIDLLSIENYAGSQPHNQFDWLRANAPVFWHESDDGGFWAVTSYDLVREVGRSHELFSSSPTIMLHDPSSDESGALGDHTMMLMTDPPAHTRMRRLVSREFTPRAARALRPKLEELAHRIVDAVADQDGCDLVTDLAGEMPSFVIADLLGIPLEDGRQLYHYTEALHSSEDAVGADARATAYFSMFEYSQQVWQDKQANPQDDLATMLAHGEIDGEPLDPIDFFLWFMLLVDAGGDTTRNLVGGGFDALFQHPDQLVALRDNLDSLLPTAIEELLRWVSPVIYMRRTATADTMLGDCRIAEGDKVVMYYAAANRDPSIFDDPHRLDLGRQPNQHVAFGGGGPHYCLGAHLARLEIEVLIRAIFERLHDLRLSGDRAWMQSNFIYGPTALPVTFRATTTA